MCGILWDTDGVLTDKDLKHRGLYSCHQETPKGILTHVRLPIVDVSHASDQPFQDENWVFTFVGELLNYKSFDPQSTSDSRTMFNLWRTSKTRLMNRMDGFWAIVAYHKHLKQLHIVTDFLAKKPLYYHVPTGSVCSEIKPLLRLGETTFDEYYFSTVRKFGYCMNDHTFINEVIKVPPRAHWIIDWQGISHRWSWGNPLIPRYITEPRMAIEEAVKDRVQADVPISLLLSGGLDSTIIFQLMKRYTEDFTVYHVENEESHYLDYLKFPLGVRIREIKTTEDIDSALLANEGPVDLGSMLPQYSLHQAIRNDDINTRVVLTGDGADELFGGYKRSMEYDSQLSDVHDELVYYHLPRLDKMSMAFTMELRSPFLSRNVVESALSLKYPLRQNKRGLKMLFDDIIPPAILERPKKPLKSKQVLFQKNWRDELQTKFRKLMMEDYGVRNV